jgi:hypothetical protein
LKCTKNSACQEFVGDGVLHLVRWWGWFGDGKKRDGEGIENDDGVLVLGDGMKRVRMGISGSGTGTREGKVVNGNILE